MVKKLLFLIAISVGMFFPTMAQNIPSYVPTNGLVGWWPFNGNANDESGNGNNGTVNGATLTTDRNGNIGKSYNFDGNSNYIRINNSASLNSTSISISGWFNTNNLATNDNLDAKGIIGKWWQSPSVCNGNYNAYLVCLTKPISQTSNFVGVATSFYEGNVFYSSTTISTSNWYHFVFIHDLNSGGKLYINGNLVNSNSSKGSICNSLNALNIGADINNGNLYRFFNGKIDDIAIYNRVLNQQEINALYTSTPPCTNPTASITPQGNTTFCQGGFVNLNASTGANYTYQWYNNGQLINGVTTSTYQANTSGSYTVKVTDGSCSTTSSATTVTVTPYPSSNVQVSGATSFCQGNNVTITSSGVGNYLWSNGATTKSITVTETGNYSVQVTQNGCTSTSSITSVTVNPNPTASITPQGNTTFCQGGFVNLVASGGTSYQWNTGASSSSITVNQSGTYVVNVFNSFGCQASASQVVVVNSNPIVAFNGLNDYTLKTQQTIQLIGSPSGGNFVGDGINGATFNPVNVTLGKKTITYNYTSPQGCKGSATRSTIIVDSVGNVCNVTKYDTVTVKNNVYDTILKLKFKLTTGINANQMTSMTLYPNPTTDLLYIEIGDAKALDGYRYRILDAVGKEVYNQLVKNPKTEIPLKSLGAAGMYLFEVIDQQNKTIQSNKIVLE